MARDFYRFNSSDEDVQLEAVETGDGRVALIYRQEARAVELRYEQVGEYEYFGRALPGSPADSPVWQITRLHSPAAGGLRKSYADGSAVYSKVWDQRATYSY